MDDVRVGPECRSLIINPTERAKMFRFKVFKDNAGKFRWRIRSTGNNKIVADCGEGYNNHQDVIDIINKLKANLYSAEVVDETKARVLFGRR